MLDGEQAALQDTNDHFLANLQRNGTYSVVPRIPGGEITGSLSRSSPTVNMFGLTPAIPGQSCGGEPRVHVPDPVMKCRSGTMTRPLLVPRPQESP